MALKDEHVAKRWVEQTYPDVHGAAKAILILTYGAGLDAGLAEAGEIVQEQMAKMREAEDEAVSHE